MISFTAYNASDCQQSSRMLDNALDIVIGKLDNALDIVIGELVLFDGGYEGRISLVMSSILKSRFQDISSVR